MKASSKKNRQAQLVRQISQLWADPQDRSRIEEAVVALDARYSLFQKIAAEPGVEAILEQMAGRLAAVYRSLSQVRGKRLLDIACGSATSRAPVVIRVDTPFGEIEIGRARGGYTAQFEPWFCRLLVELGAEPVGIDFGDLEGEAFEHYRVDLGQTGALTFLPDHSFDGIQDSRLFGSPEFTAQFPSQADRLAVAEEIMRQEQRLLKPGGLIIHSDAAGLVGGGGVSRAAGRPAP